MNKSEAEENIVCPNLKEKLALVPEEPDTSSMETIIPSISGFVKLHVNFLTINYHS